MIFDDIVSQIFDEIIDWVSRLERELPTIGEILKDYECNKILDVGCSTGMHAIALGRQGYNVTGIDYSNFAIKTARERLSKEYLPDDVSVKFYQDDFSVFSHLSTNEYDGVLILGNTLSLASSTESVVEVLENVHKVLKNDGVVIIQVLNFANTESNTHFTNLRTFEWEEFECIVQRGYLIQQGFGTFLFNVLRNENGIWKYWIKETSSIYPFNKGRLEYVVNKTGFKIKKLYSDFDMTKFDEKSKSIFAILEKTK